MDQNQVEQIAGAFSKRAGVTRGRAFGTDSLMVHEKIFALFRLEGVVFKLPKERVTALIASGTGTPFTSGTRTMQEWVVVPNASADLWMDLAEEAFAFVGN